jgi:uncharacterized RDD family membrane protein YckC
MSGAHSQSPRLRRVGTKALQTLLDRVAQAVRAVAFWAAVVLPLAYLPLLGGGIAGGESVPFLALLATNVLALTLGHDYAR